MAGNPDTSGFAGERRPFDMPRSQPQSLRCRPLQDYYRHSNPWNFNAAQNISFFERFPGLNDWMQFFRLCLFIQRVACDVQK